MSNTRLRTVVMDRATHVNYSLRPLLKSLVKHGASDLHLKAGRPPLYRVNGKLIPAKLSELTSQQVQDLLYSVANKKLIEQFERDLQIDFSFRIENMGRFRVNMYIQRGSVAAVIRMIPLTVPSLESLGLPTVLSELTSRERGLVLITGATGTGKSTTLAALVNKINEKQHLHIVTIEDPIEFVHRDVKSSICQREIGTDAHTMREALESALRQDPDVIVIGELRDYETISIAMTAAETGHLVLSTLHTNDARSSITRILDVFPAEAKNQARIQLSSSLLAVVSQKLILNVPEKKRVPVCEILVKSPTIENLIRNNELHRIDEAISTSTTYYKMQTFNQALENMVHQNLVQKEEAIAASNYPDELRMRLAGFKKEEGY
ncbi:MAG: type IV pilus twitching motility protein PilT [Bacteriovoracia bacterium]